MLRINVTSKADVVQNIDADEINHIKIGLFECEIFFEDGRTLQVKEDFEEVRRRIREAKKQQIRQ